MLLVFAIAFGVLQGTRWDLQSEHMHHEQGTLAEAIWLKQLEALVKFEDGDAPVLDTSIVRHRASRSYSVQRPSYTLVDATEWSEDERRAAFAELMESMQRMPELEAGWFKDAGVWRVVDLEDLVVLEEGKKLVFKELVGIAWAKTEEEWTASRDAQWADAMQRVRLEAGERPVKRCRTVASD